ncbi:MAG: S1 RNA-binding domain-containing protein [Patescibacteria group bacterium]
MNTNTIRKPNISPLGALIKKSSEFKLFVVGEIVDAILIEKAQKAAYFNLGPFGTGMVYGAEFSNASHILKSLNPGDPISAKVVSMEGENGYIELSLAEAGIQKSWEIIKELEERGEIISVKISGANAGGLLTELHGIRAFVPVSQLSHDHYPRIDDGDRTKIMEELKKFVGTDLKVKIIDMKPRAKKLILSEREGSDAGNAKELLEKYKVGETIEGVVSGVADFGAFIKFVDNPQIEGLVHISELDHKLIESPKEIVKIGDAVQAKIIEIKEGKVSLSLKALKLDPWLKVGERYKAGTEAKGTVTRFNPFGAFVALDSEIQGLIHVSEFGSVDEMKAKIEIGKIYSFSIELVKPEEKRIILKMKK